MSIPCEICGAMVLFEQYESHVFAHQLEQDQEVEDVGIKCDVCGKQVKFSEYASHGKKHEQEYEEEKKQKAEQQKKAAEEYQKQLAYKQLHPDYKPGVIVESKSFSFADHSSFSTQLVPEFPSQMSSIRRILSQFFPMNYSPSSTSPPAVSSDSAVGKGGFDRYGGNTTYSAKGGYGGSRVNQDLSAFQEFTDNRERKMFERCFYLHTMITIVHTIETKAQDEIGDSSVILSEFCELLRGSKSLFVFLMDVLTEDWVSSVERISDGLLAIVEFFSYMAIHPPLHPFLFHIPSPPSSSSSSSPSSSSSSPSSFTPAKPNPPPLLYVRLTALNNIISNFLKLQSKMTGINADLPSHAITDVNAIATGTITSEGAGTGTDATTITASTPTPAAATTPAATGATAATIISASGSGLVPGASKGVLSYLLHFLKAFWKTSGGAVQQDYLEDVQDASVGVDTLEYDEDGAPLPTNPDIVVNEQKGSPSAAVAAEALVKMQADVAHAFVSMYVLVHAAYVTFTTPQPSSSSSPSSPASSSPSSSSTSALSTEVVSPLPAKATAASSSTSSVLSGQVVDPRVYVDTLRPLQFVTLDNSDGARAQEFEKTNIFYSTLQQEGTAIRPNMGKIMAQLNILSQGLPLDVSSSVFVITSSLQVRLLKAMIIGPKDTPYEHGAFEFDIHLPPTFPNVAPQVKIITTGNGAVRFNPNLYADGKVCLSLLGTWHGSAGESWNPKVSTILQVFVSLQALVFVDEPFYNEPGYEGTMGSTNGIAQSKAYNDNIRLQTLNWAVLNQLERAKSQKSPFHTAILAHLRLKKHEIIATTRKWAGESKSITQSLVQRIEKEVGGL